MDDTEDKEVEGEELRFELVEREDFDIYTASSVRGGIQMRGDFLIEFFTERFETPGAEVYRLEDGLPGEFLRNEEYANSIVRQKQTGVMMTQSNAFSMAKWVLANLLGDGVKEENIEEVLAENFPEKFDDGDNNGN